MNRGIGIVAMLALLVASCTEESSPPPPADTMAHLRVRLTDKPGDFQEVNIDIQEVQIKAGDEDAEWMTIETRTGIYDLLKLTNGLDTLLAEAELPPGRLTQIRLVLGDNNTVRVRNEVHELEIPSGSESGLKINVQLDLEVGKSYEVLLDFDAARSIIKAHRKDFKLKPVIRAILEEILGEPGQNPQPPGEQPPPNVRGSISGAVNPPASNPAIHAILGTDTLSTMINNEGRFLIQDMPDGTYRLVFDPIEGYLQEELDNVQVNRGVVTNVGTVNIGSL